MEVEDKNPFNHLLNSYSFFSIYISVVLVSLSSSVSLHPLVNPTWLINLPVFYASSHMVSNANFSRVPAFTSLLYSSKVSNGSWRLWAGHSLCCPPWWGSIPSFGGWKMVLNGALRLVSKVWLLEELRSFHLLPLTIVKTERHQWKPDNYN